MEKFEEKIYKNTKETSKAANPPENLPIKEKEIEIEIDISDFEMENAVLEENIESGDAKKIREAMEFSEYCSSSADFFSCFRKSYKQYAEKARLILESKRDASLLPFDEKEELKKLRNQRKRIVKEVKNGEITREMGLEISRADFENFKRERDWQREGMEYFERRIRDDMLEKMRTSAGVSALEGRMILENEEELKEYTKANGQDAAIKLLEVPAGDFDNRESHSSWLYLSRRMSDEIDARAVFYRFTDEKKEYVKNHVFGHLISKRADVVAKIKKGLNKNNTVEEITGMRGIDPVKMKIIPTAFTFYIRCGDKKDYAALFTGKEEKELTKKDIKDACESCGFYGRKNYLAEKNIGNKKFGAREFEVFAHEEQHFFDRMFQRGECLREFDFFLDHAANRLARREIETGKKDFENTKYEIGRALRKFRERWEWRAASEFLAFFRQGGNPDRILEVLETEKNHGGLYDYFDEETRKKIFKHITENFDEMGSAETYMVVNHVLVEEYKKMINEAAEALGLLKKVEYTISKHNIISFLQKIPLRKWLPETRKLLKNKKEKDI